MTKTEALRAVPMFRRLPADLHARLLESCHERTVHRGESLFLEGEPPQALFVVWRGRVKIYKAGESGREQILEIEGPGRSVAELPLFDGMPYPASCAALEDTIVLTMPARAFHDFLREEPALARAALQSLALRIRHLAGLVGELSLKAVRDRLAGLLLDLAGDGDTIELGLNNQEIAARIGTVREIVSRTLHRMAEEGALRLEGRTVILLDRRLL